MKRPHRNRRLVLALYANAALLLAILLALLGHGSPTLLPLASASPPPDRAGRPAANSGMQGVAGNDHLYIMPGELLNNVWGCYLLDLDNQTLCVYGYSGNQLKLYAARNIRFDHQLRNYNTSPDPEEIRQLIELEKTKVRGLRAPPTTNNAQSTTDN
ncbi:MAG TPA: hypothetical protein VFC78_02885 [Tepidisphaeraceae bacterium]|nr:hypothetical protein [Tepidisphaeraceae bacterium]